MGTLTGVGVEMHREKVLTHAAAKQRVQFYPNTYVADKLALFFSFSLLFVKRR